MTLGRRGAALACTLFLSAAMLAGCSSPQPADDAPTAPLSSLPQHLRDSGKLTVGTNIPFAPMEFREANGVLSGFDVDVLNAAAADLGLTADFRELGFPELLPGVVAGEVDVAARGLFDTPARQSQVDLVTYYSAGTQWARKAGTDVDPNDACGLKVGAETDTVQFLAELPAKSDACTDTGKEALEVVRFASLDAALEALRAGDISAVSADSPAILWEVKKSPDSLEAADAPFDTQPYAFAVAKGSALGPALQQSIQRLIDSGEIKKIAEKWGLGDGLIPTSLINGAVN
ncbi:ABC transporter substrate-binding protein [Gordonia phosphorivorans]|uniref:ABC transporter substrate-binding protein n=1 Tax=Gordonia phosphorivorans TaxID=1056982 RepID=A0ABV6H832_9ACTN